MTWYSNTIQICGESSKVNDFKKALKGKKAMYSDEKYDEDWESNEVYTLNAIIPVPKEILKVGYGGNGDLARSGYRWQLENWGAKWDINITDYDIEVGTVSGKSMMVLRMETSYGHIKPAVMQMAKLYPYLDFEINYASNSDGDIGFAIYEKGELKSSDENGDSSMESVIKYKLRHGLYEDIWTFIYHYIGCEDDKDEYNTIVDLWKAYNGNEGVPEFKEVLVNI